MKRFNETGKTTRWLPLLCLVAPVLAPSLAVAAAPQEGAAKGGKPPVRAAGGHRHGGGEHPWVLADMGGAKVTLWRSDLKAVPVPFDGEWAFAPGSGVDNYHALVAVAEGEGGTRSVIKYLYRNGKPSGESPSALLAQVKAPLEIVPDPLPREHYRYIEGERWGYRLRLDGEPVAEATVNLVTLNGSHLEGHTDAAGYVAFTLPEDFRDVRPGRTANPSRPFRVSAVVERDGRRHESTLQAEYHASPRHWQSGRMGLWVMGGGLLAGLAVSGLGRREPEGSKKQGGDA